MCVYTCGGPHWASSSISLHLVYLESRVYHWTWSFPIKIDWVLPRTETVAAPHNICIVMWLLGVLSCTLQHLDYNKAAGDPHTGPHDAHIPVTISESISKQGPSGTLMDCPLPHDLELTWLIAEFR